MDKREIERRRLATKALAPLMPEAFATPEGRIAFNALIIRLAEKAIVIPIRVRHIVSGQIGKPERTVEITKISLGYEHPERGWIDMPTEEIGGHHGIPGKATCIILPDRASIEDSRTDGASREEEDGG